MRHKAHVRGVLWVVALAAVSAAAGCHTVHQCPILQALAGGRIPAPLPPPGSTYEVVGRRDGIRFHIVKYNENLYRGGDILDRRGAEALRAIGIKTVVSVSPSREERSLAKEFGFALVEIPFGLYDMTKGHLDRFLAALQANPGPFYVHSFDGINQAGILLAHYRIHREGWSVDKALAEYWRLDANYWDSLHMVDVLKRSAPASPS